MATNLHTPTRVYSSYKSDIKRIGGTNKANKAIHTEAARKAIEEEFMAFAYKVGRSESQREERRSKRQ